MGNIDVAFIDCCHDTEFVYNDTVKVMENMKPGSFILWHDFNLDLVKRYGWIQSVCMGIERLYEKGLLKGPIYHIRDSWIGSISPRKARQCTVTRDTSVASHSSRSIMPCTRPSAGPVLSWNGHLP